MDMAVMSLFNESLDQGVAGYNYSNLTPTTYLNATSQEGLGQTAEAPYDKWVNILNGVTIPAISVFGLIGNLLNLVILSARCCKKEVDVLERGALTVLIALALSDLLFCTTSIPYAKFRKPNKAMYFSRGLDYYFQMYRLYFQNVFIKTSTCLTCIVGLARYVGICHPMKARIFIGIWNIRVAIVLAYIFWFAAMVPLLWNYEVTYYPITNNTGLYIFDQGYFSKAITFYKTFSFLWFILGYLIPIAILGFCNARLIGALRQSVRLRSSTASGQSTSQKQRDVSNRITLTLVALIVMYMVLVSPSEVLEFVSLLVESNTYATFELGMTISNVLQAINVSFHFVLYCCVNATFRRTIFSLFQCGRSRDSSSSSGGEPRTTQSYISMRNGNSITGNSSPCPHTVKILQPSSSTTDTVL